MPYRGAWTFWKHNRKVKQLLPYILAAFIFQSVSAQDPELEWPVFRGKSDLTGFTANELTSSPSLLWSYSAGTRSRSSPVISSGTIFFGTDKGTILAVENDGKLKWKYEGGGSAESPPLVYGNSVITGFGDGSLHSVDRTT